MRISDWSSDVCSSDLAVWLSRPPLAAYAASKAALWSFTNAIRSDLRGQSILVQGLHVSFMDTDMTKGLEMKKVRPCLVVETALTGLEGDREEGLADEFTRRSEEHTSELQPLMRISYADV